MKESVKKSEDRIFTLPNILTVFRLVLIPVFIILYFHGMYPLSTGVLVLSGVTDVVDGIIARKLDLVTRLGKALDPIADKFTQGIVLLCLVWRFRLMLLPLIVLLVKEVVNSVLHILVIRKTGDVHSASWHGKVSTVYLYFLIALHVLWFDIPVILSTVLIAVCTALILISMILYIIKYSAIIREK